MIRKPAIIITSLGRTGTRFFSVFFNEIIPDSASLHEPDTFHLDLKRTLKQIRRAGVYNMVIRKALGAWSMPSLSHARVQGELAYDEAVHRVLGQRERFVRSLREGVYIESALANYGLIDVMKDVYEQHRVIYIVRNGRDWVRSKMNRAVMYNRGVIQRLFAHRWPDASGFDDDPCRLEWDSMTRFEKLCWAWAKLNGYALETIPRNPHARLFRFEDIFESAERYQHLADVVDFATAHLSAKSFPAESLNGWLDRRINISSSTFPSWENWTTEQQQRFDTFCGPLMDELGYESG
jgi:hypothetical protein